MMRAVEVTSADDINSVDYQILGLAERCDEELSF
jgi:hypothetical protein